MLGELTRVWQTAVRVTPLSSWTFLIAAVGALASLLAWRPLVRATGWRSLPTLLAMLSLTGIVALTLGPGIGSDDDSLRQCVAEIGELSLRQLRWLRHSADGLLNIAMVVPFGLTAVLAVRRVWPIAAVVLALPLVIEVAQTLIPGRHCNPIDYLTNVAGGLVGVGAGALVLGAQRWAAHRARRSR